MTRVIPLLDGYIDFDPLLFPAARAEPEKAAHLLGSKTLPTQIDVPVWCYLIHTDAGPCLVDTGGDGLFGSPSALQKQLYEHGVAPGEIHRIWLTHLHGDHCGGLITKDGEPAFPNARLALPESETIYWFQPELDGTRAEIARDARTALAPYTGRIDDVAPGTEIDGAEALVARGHTPGHTAWLFADHGALAAGDIFHLPALQLPNPDWSTDWDIDPSAAAETRKALLKRAGKDGLTLLTGHGGLLDTRRLHTGLTV